MVTLNAVLVNGEGSNRLTNPDGRRRGPFTSTTTVDASGGYVLAAYQVRPWLQPVLK